MNVPAFFDAEENEAYGKTYRWRLEQLARFLSPGEAGFLGQNPVPNGW